MGIAKLTPSLSWRRTKTQRQCDLVRMAASCLLMAGVGVYVLFRATAAGRHCDCVSSFRCKSGLEHYPYMFVRCVDQSSGDPSWIGHWVSASGRQAA